MTNGIKRVIGIFCIGILLLSACKSLKNIRANTSIRKNLRSEVFTSQFTGLVLFDPETGKYLYDRNGELFFTPASNTKILTALACLETFNDSIPSLSYYEIADTIYIEPLGDPTILHPDFPRQPVMKKLENKTVKVYFPEISLPRFGPGWAWDDYQYSFQPQTAWLPLYANEVRIFSGEDSLQVIPDFFEDYINVFVGEKPGNFVHRELKYNLFNIWMENDTSGFERKIPFDYSEELVLQLLSDTLNSPVMMLDSLNVGLYGTLYNQATIPTVALMMLKSDNFLAEQLLVTAARESGYKNQQAYRNYLISKWDLPPGIQWVDGSGLSRYNLFTPKMLVKVLHKIYQLQDWKTLTCIFPAGGISGTIKNWYRAGEPYVYAKTGTLSNNHSLSGFIKTRSGRILIFSLMNNHYTRPVDEVKTEMQLLLETIRDRY